LSFQNLAFRLLKYHDLSRLFPELSGVFKKVLANDGHKDGQEDRDDEDRDDEDRDDEDRDDEDRDDEDRDDEDRDDEDRDDEDRDDEDGDDEDEEENETWDGNTARDRNIAIACRFPQRTKEKLKDMEVFLDQSQEIYNREYLLRESFVSLTD